MKLKYYLRGLGIGILVTALIMGVTGSKELTDQEIKARALQLGMVEAPEANVLSDLQASANDETKEDKVVEESIPMMETAEATQASEVVETETVESSESAEVIKESESIQTTQETENTTVESTGNLVSITVNGGDSSVTVSNALAAAGLVADAKEFDRYLCSNGYDKSICVGTYEIEMGSDYETIAKIITKR